MSWGRSSLTAATRAPHATTGQAALRPSAKAHLTTELQLYFSRLTSALVPPVSALATLPGNPPAGSSTHSFPEPERHRLAALASVRADAAVAGVLAYLVRWVAESINKTLAGPTGTIGCLIDVVEAILDNDVLFVEPYLHQFLGPLMSILLTVPLGPHPPVSTSPSAFDLRVRAADVLAKLVSLYGKNYPGLVPRLVSTLSKALHMPTSPSPVDTPPAGRYEGAVLGLAACGHLSVRETLWGERGEQLAHIDGLIGSLYPTTSDNKKSKTGLVRATVKALGTMVGAKPADVPPLPSQEELAVFGTYIPRALEKRPWLASEMVRMHREGPGAETAGAENDGDEEMVEV